MSQNKKPPYMLVKTWLDIYYSRETPEHAEAQNVVEHLILENFNSLYEAEMHIYLEKKPRSEKSHVQSSTLINSI
jgi:hypothetical protein